MMIIFYQREGVTFGLFKTGVLIGDEMGLEKTLQAIALDILKKEIFDFSKILIVTLASLKEQWKREVEKLSDEEAVIIEGSPDNRKMLYQKSTELFKITNYEAVLRKDLPDEVVNNYYIDLTVEQMEIHAGYARSLLPLINKKYLTPMDVRKLQVLLLRMRMVCDSSYLIDRETHFSPKLKELESIVDELVIQNKHKIVIFSEWTTMIFQQKMNKSDDQEKMIEINRTTGEVTMKFKLPGF